MPSYPAKQPARVFTWGSDNMSAQASYTPPTDPSTLLPDERIEVWDATLGAWVVGDPNLANGTQDDGGTGMLLPQIAEQAFRVAGAVGFKYLSIAEADTDVQQFAPDSAELLPGPGVNRWTYGLQLAASSGLEPRYMVTWIGEGTAAILTGPEIEDAYRKIVVSARSEWADTLCRFVCCVAPVRLDVPGPAIPPTQSTRGVMLRAIEAVAADYPGFMVVVDLARYDLNTYPAEYPHQTFTEYGEIAALIEAALRG